MRDRIQQWETLANSLSNYIPRGVKDIHDQHIAARIFFFFFSTNRPSSDTNIKVFEVKKIAKEEYLSGFAGRGSRPDNRVT